MTDTQNAPPDTKQISDSLAGAAGCAWIGLGAYLIFVVVSIFRHHAQETTSLWSYGWYVLIGLFIVAWAVSLTVSARKFGESVFGLKTSLAVPGGAVTGTVRIARPFTFRDGIQVHLQCIHWTSSGKSSSHNTVWESFYTLDRFSPNAIISEIPVYFVIPADVRPTGSVPGWGGDQGIRWRLEITAKTDGIHYSSSFDLPVTAAPGGAQSLELPPDPTVELRSPDVARRHLLDPNIRLTPLPGGGSQCEILPAYNRSMALVLIVLGAAAMIFGLSPMRFGYEIISHYLFPLAGAIAAIIGLRLLLLKVTITARHGSLTIRRAVLFFTSENLIPATGIRDISPKIQMQPLEKAWYSISADRTDAKPIKLCGMIRDKRDADWLAAELKRSVGLT